MSEYTASPQLIAAKETFKYAQRSSIDFKMVNADKHLDDKEYEHMHHLDATAGDTLEAYRLVQGLDPWLYAEKTRVQALQDLDYSNSYTHGQELFAEVVLDNAHPAVVDHRKLV